MAITLRDYQIESVDALWDWFCQNEKGNPLVVAPVGAGKSILMAEFVRRALECDPKCRILNITHSQELIVQNRNKLHELIPYAPSGIYSASLGKRDIKAQILFGGVQSIAKKAAKVQRCEILLVDEAHTISRKDKTLWQTFIKELLQINPDLRIVGYTGTPYRLDSGSLVKGDDAVFCDIAHEIKMIDLIKKGYLCPVISKPQAVKIDTSDVTVRGGEFVAGQLEAAADLVTEEAVTEIIEQGKDRKCWMVFCAGVKHAEHVCEVMIQHGISCAVITGDTNKEERERTIRLWREGKIRCVSNVSCLTTGLDVPPIDLIATLRPTMSPGLVVQCIGRGVRLSPGKEDCLLLDFAGWLSRFGPVDMIQAPRGKIGEGEGDAPSKQCPECDTKLPAGMTACPVCGHDFPREAPKISVTASTEAALSIHIKPQWVEVDNVTYQRHEKLGKTPKLCAVYQCGLTFYKEYLAFEDEGYALFKAKEWWANRTSLPAPANVNEAVANSIYLCPPEEVLIKQNGKFFNIEAARF